MNRLSYCCDCPERYSLHLRSGRTPVRSTASRKLVGIVRWYFDYHAEPFNKKLAQYQTAPSKENSER
jgi:hypothetical protein